VRIGAAPECSWQGIAVNRSDSAMAAHRHDHGGHGVPLTGFQSLPGLIPAPAALAERHFPVKDEFRIVSGVRAFKEPACAGGGYRAIDWAADPPSPPVREAEQTERSEKWQKSPSSASA
jgi:hypothetical protein